MRIAARRDCLSPLDSQASKAAPRADVTAGSTAGEPLVTMLQSERMRARSCSVASAATREIPEDSCTCVRERSPEGTRSCVFESRTARH